MTVVSVVHRGSTEPAAQLLPVMTARFGRCVVPAGKTLLSATWKVSVAEPPALMSTPVQVIVRLPASYEQVTLQVLMSKAALLATRAGDRTSVTVWLVASALPELATTILKSSVSPVLALVEWLYVEVPSTLTVFSRVRIGAAVTVVSVVHRGSTEPAAQLLPVMTARFGRCVVPAGKTLLSATWKVSVAEPPALMSTPVQVIVRLPASYEQVTLQVLMSKAALLATRAGDRTSVTVWLVALALPELATTILKSSVSPVLALVEWLYVEVPSTLTVFSRVRIGAAVTVVSVVHRGSTEPAAQLLPVMTARFGRCVVPAGKTLLSATWKVSVAEPPALMSTPVQVIVRLPASYEQVTLQVLMSKAALLATRAGDRTSVTVWLVALALPELATTILKSSVSPVLALVEWLYVEVPSTLTVFSRVRIGAAGTWVSVEHVTSWEPAAQLLPRPTTTTVLSRCVVPAGKTLASVAENVSVTVAPWAMSPDQLIVGAV